MPRRCLWPCRLPLFVLGRKDQCAAAVVGLSGGTLASCLAHEDVSNGLAPPFFVPRLSDRVLIVAYVTLPLTPDFFFKTLRMLSGCVIVLEVI